MVSNIQLLVPFWLTFEDQKLQSTKATSDLTEPDSLKHDRKSRGIVLHGGKTSKEVRLVERSTQECVTGLQSCRVAAHTAHTRVITHHQLVLDPPMDTF